MERNKVIAILILALAISLACVQCEHNKYNDAENNYRVMCDSMKVLTSKYNDEIFARQSLIVDKKELEKALDISRKELTDLEKTLHETVAYYSNLSGIVEYDTLIMKDTMWVEKDVEYVRFSYADTWSIIDGVTKIENKIPQTSINILSISVPLHVGLTDNYTIFVTSNNPYVHFTDIEGAVIDGSKLKATERRFGLGLHAGFGVQYNLLGKNIGVGPEVGVGLNYKLF